VPRPLSIAELCRRLLAATAAALVLALTLLGASPAAHAWLHRGEQRHVCHQHTKPVPPTAEHDCAVVLFAGTVDVPVGPVALTPPVDVSAGVSPVTAADFFLVSPRYLRQPERGPPVYRVS
jgi:hypothetical protein